MHPVLEKLRKTRMERGISRERLVRKARIDRNSLRKREEGEFPAMAALDRWCQALGFELTLKEIDPPA